MSIPVPTDSEGTVAAQRKLRRLVQAEVKAAQSATQAETIRRLDAFEHGQMEMRQDVGTLLAYMAEQTQSQAEAEQKREIARHNQAIFFARVGHALGGALSAGIGVAGTVLGNMLTHSYPSAGALGFGIGAFGLLVSCYFVVMMFTYGHKAV